MRSVSPGFNHKIKHVDKIILIPSTLAVFTGVFISNFVNIANFLSHGCLIVIPNLSLFMLQYLSNSRCLDV